MPGSSPRWRGARQHVGNRRPRLGIIPALAGSTRPLVGRRRPASDHPRAGGEHSSWTGLSSSPNGSSPRWRGARLRRGVLTLVLRIIPALAGSTPCPQCCAPSRSDHPRAGGEHPVRSSSARRMIGSSPRWRGAPSRSISSLGWQRIIPALAGSTVIDGGSPAEPGDHPRAGGEHLVDLDPQGNLVGSSPRWRGAPRRRGSDGPAVVDHPRAGGEHRSIDPRVG